MPDKERVNRLAGLKEELDQARKAMLAAVMETKRGVLRHNSAIDHFQRAVTAYQEYHQLTHGKPAEESDDAFRPADRISLDVQIEEDQPDELDQDQQPDELDQDQADDVDEAPAQGQQWTPSAKVDVQEAAPPEPAPPPAGQETKKPQKSKRTG
jgi:hypothetical protein